MDNNNIFSQKELGIKSANLETTIANEEADIEADKNRKYMAEEQKKDESYILKYDFYKGTGIDEDQMNDMIKKSSETISNL